MHFDVNTPNTINYIFDRIALVNFYAYYNDTAPYQIVVRNVNDYVIGGTSAPSVGIPQKLMYTMLVSPGTYKIDFYYHNAGNNNVGIEGVYLS